MRHGLLLCVFERVCVCDTGGTRGEKCEYVYSEVYTVRERARVSTRARTCECVCVCVREKARACVTVCV